MPINQRTRIIYHVGPSHDCHSIVQSGFVAGGEDTKEGRQTVFFTVDPVNEPREDEPHDVTKPRQVPYRNRWKSVPERSFWISLKSAQEKGLAFWQTRSNAIIPDNSVPAD